MGLNHFEDFLLLLSDANINGITRVVVSTSVLDEASLSDSFARAPGFVLGTLLNAVPVLAVSNLLVPAVEKIERVQKELIPTFAGNVGDRLVRSDHRHVLHGRTDVVGTRFAKFKFFSKRTKLRDLSFRSTLKE